MKKYTIENKEWNTIACRVKGGGRHYRQNKNHINKRLEIVKTTYGRAIKERDFLNENYDEGWEVYEVQDDERRNRQLVH